MTFDDYCDRAELLRLLGMLNVNELTLNGLRQMGVSPDAIASQDVAIGSLHVRFDNRNKLFIPDDAGVPSIIIAPPSDDPLNDVIAFDPTTPSRFASFTGRMFALGDHLIDNPATYFAGRGLPLYRTPVEWLQANCQGLCIVDQRPTAIRARLAPVPRVIVADLAHGRELRALFGRMLQRPKIIVPSNRRVAA